MDSRQSRKRYTYRRRPASRSYTSSAPSSYASSTSPYEREAGRADQTRGGLIPTRSARRGSRHARKGESLVLAGIRDAAAGLRSGLGRVAERVRSVAGPYLSKIAARARRYSTQLTAMAGIVIVILSVYLIQQGSLVPSTYHFGPGEPGVEADAPAGTGDGETGGGEATVPGGETGGAPADAGTGTAGAQTGAGQTPSSGSGTGTAVAADPAGEPVRMVVDLEGQTRATVGPLSREDCYRSMVSPATGKVVRPHGFYDSTLFQDTRYHTGVDIALKTGDPVRAALGGLVTHASHTSSEAWRIEITHGFGVVTVYSHLGAAHVKSGDMVTTGRHIGTAGLPGDLEFDLGVHLHFEIRVDGDSIDPAPYVGS